MARDAAIELVTHLLLNNPAMYVSDPRGLARMIVAGVRANIQGSEFYCPDCGWEHAPGNCKLRWRVTGKDKA